MVQIKQDRFFNHFTNPAGPFDTKPVTQPVLWMPHNEIANSPTNPVLLTDGPFKGQMLWGDLTYGGLQRGFLEKVDGEFQGAVFRHSAGLEVGVNRTVIGPDGAIYVGGTGEGGNWGEDNKLRYGLQKLTPNGNNVFDMEKMEVIEGGFKITYTHPVGDAAASRSSRTRTSSSSGATSRRRSTAGRRSTRSPCWSRTPRSPATRRRSRSTSTASSRAASCTSARSVPSPRAPGEELWNTEAWYTLNSLPGYEAPAAIGLLRGRGGPARQRRRASQTEHSGYSGSGFVGGFSTAGANLTFTVNVDAAGTYPVNLRYANGPNPSTKTKTVALYVNGEKQTELGAADHAARPTGRRGRSTRATWR